MSKELERANLRFKIALQIHLMIRPSANLTDLVVKLPDLVDAVVVNDHRQVAADVDELTTAIFTAVLGQIQEQLAACPQTAAIATYLHESRQLPIPSPTSSGVRGYNQLCGLIRSGLELLKDVTGADYSSPI